ncbi:hypothetical protein C8J57DRAFT_1461775 [Mycena rebaudengoi]|nr:hypothetical protein C8J57DRAFT_1461775 [Mycena rebaudengoi]
MSRWSTGHFESETACLDEGIGDSGRRKIGAGVKLAFAGPYVGEGALCSCLAVGQDADDPGRFSRIGGGGKDQAGAWESIDRHVGLSDDEGRWGGVGFVFALLHVLVVFDAVWVSVIEEKFKSVH